MKSAVSAWCHDSGGGKPDNKTTVKQSKLTIQYFLLDFSLTVFSP